LFKAGSSPIALEESKFTVSKRLILNLAGKVLLFLKPLDKRYVYAVQLGGV
jgi:hypothetical protein